MAYTRAQIREAVERAGDAHWQALIRHHEDAYPASRVKEHALSGKPLSGVEAADAGLINRAVPFDRLEAEVRAEAERLNQLGLGDARDLTLVETRVERTDSTLRIFHLFEYGPQKARLLTEPFEGYGGEE